MIHYNLNIYFDTNIKRIQLQTHYAKLEVLSCKRSFQSLLCKSLNFR